MRRLSLISLIFISVAGLAACSRSSDPAAPTSVSGATINGSIVTAGASSGGTNGSTIGSSTMSTFSVASTAPAGLTVSVAGTNISAAVDALGQFSLKNVPPGNADLRFSFPGFAAGLPLSDLQNGQIVSIAVSLTASSVVLESDRRASGSEVQLEGRVELLTPTPAPPSFVVAGQMVTTNASTTFYLHGQPAAFADLELGQRVHVKGQTTGTGTSASLLAREVNIQNTSTSTGLNLNGVISGFKGTASGFEFTVNGQLVKGDAATEFFGNSQFAQLINGAVVEVKGSQRSGYIYAVRLHVEVDDANELEFTGVILAPITGTAPDLAFRVDSAVDYDVLTSALTDVQRKGDKQTPATLQVGMTVQVSGQLLTSGKVLAKKIQIEGDAVSGKFEMTGHIGGLSGTCPTVSFSVSGYQITTTSTVPATTFSPSCASLSNGTEVKVEGIVQADFSVKATKVEKK